ncbi:xanthine dehydrogenase family protein molybdopterin-binding subunit [Rhodopseudomonas sp. HC1]|uniref:xanthine dehydrogenase family protein molybdopterin-binding subunit n=1 Tax=Rhodopseudomonas infernalis TaxID=2897386 RepID=UPI001EE8057F|nr:xanthine dehydrogenase family protein molybdopterin-binding subunit [Rhodopseudomonas infernalis]MCG6204226.1 xanthine dehydrogenase family protein molybdopterin-binding subunit [Rhodopseudomonas infernalis]
MQRSNTMVGRAVERLEDARFLTGRGQYVGDLATPDTVYAVIVRSNVAHGRIVRIDVDPAVAHPDVVAVLTSRDIGSVPMIPLRQQVLPEGEPYLQPVIAHEVVRYVGEPLAVVVAASAALAEDAAALVEVEIEPLPAVASVEAARNDDQLLFAASGSNRAILMRAEKGDVEAAFRDADYVRKASFSTQRHTAMTMETRGLFAQWDAAAEHLTLSGAAKVPFFNRRTLAGMLGLAETQVDLIEVDVGGGFGARGEFYPEDFLIPFAAKRLARPVRWTEDRREHFMAMNHAREMAAALEIACRRDGKVVGLRGTIEVDIGAYVRTNGFTAPRNVAQFLSGPYSIANVGVDAEVFVTNKTPAGTYRGPGRFEAAFFFERLLEMAATDLGIAPDEIRRRNLIAEHEMPYKMPRTRHVDPSSETACDSGVYAVVFERCLEEFGWHRRVADQGRLIDGKYHGFGLGCFIEGGAAGPRESARMTLRPDGGVDLDVGSSAIGQGLETVMAQIASDAIEVPIEQIRVRHGSTTLVKEGFGSFHSRSTVMGGNAVGLAAEALKREIARVSAAAFSCTPEQVGIADGAAAFGGRKLSFSELARQGVSAEATFSNTKHTYSYGSHAVHLTVDPRTGQVEILDYLTVEDVGKIINPATLHGQVIGSVVQGLGSVFLEQIHYDEDGQLLTGSLAEYLLPSVANFPNIRSVSLELRPSPNNPLGAKGAGEGGLIAVGGAVGNAIAGALRSFGCEPCHLPFTPPRLWHLMHSSSEAHRKEVR